MDLERITVKSKSDSRIAWPGPAFMVGEYLTELDLHEVEIARIEMASVTGDVISIRARPTGNSIHLSGRG